MCVSDTRNKSGKTREKKTKILANCLYTTGIHKYVNLQFLMKKHIESHILVHGMYMSQVVQFTISCLGLPFTQTFELKWTTRKQIFSRYYLQILPKHKDENWIPCRPPSKVRHKVSHSSPSSYQSSYPMIPNHTPSMSSQTISHKELLPVSCSSS